MADPEAPEPFSISPLGSPQDDVREISETDDLYRIRRFKPDAYGEVGVKLYEPKDAGEANSIHRTRGEVSNRRLASRVGLFVIALIAAGALCTFMGWTHSTAQNAHEDAVRLLILILGAVLGALFASETNKDRG